MVAFQFSKNSLNLILSTLWSLFGFQIFNDFEKRERSVRYSFLSGSLSQRTCPGQMTTLWWPASSHMDITSHYAFFASTRNSWMELFPANFANVLFKLIFQRKEQIRYKTLTQSPKNLHRSLPRPGTRSAHCRGKTPQTYKTKFLKLQSKSIKTFIFVETDLILSEHRTGSVPF